MHRPWNSRPRVRNPKPSHTPAVHPLRGYYLSELGLLGAEVDRSACIMCISEGPVSQCRWCAKNSSRPMADTCKPEQSLLINLMQSAFQRHPTLSSRVEKQFPDLQRQQGSNNNDSEGLGLSSLLREIVLTFHCTRQARYHWAPSPDWPPVKL